MFGIGLTNIGCSAAANQIFNPSIIPNLTLWLRGSSQGFSDAAGTIPSISPNGRVRNMPQPSPLTGSWLSASDVNAPFCTPGGLDFTPVTSNGTSIFQPVGTTLTSNSCTLAIAFESYQPEDMPQYNGLMIGSDSQVWGPWIFTGQLRSYYNTGTTWIAGGSVMPLNTPCVAIYRYSPTGITIDYSVNGVVKSQLSLITTINSHSINLISQYVSSAGNYHGKISHQIAYNRTINDTETATLLSGLASISAPAGYPLNCPLIATSGDSISIGTGTSTLQQGMFTIMMPNIWPTAPAKLLLGGVGGQTIAGAVSRYPTIQKPRYSASRTKNIMIAQIGTNTLSVTTPASTVLASYFAHCDTMRADGWKVIACTILPRSDINITNPNWTTDRAAYNSGIVANWAQHADALCDFASVSGMGADGNETNTTNYNIDKLHPKATGYVLLEPTIRAAVLSLLP